jgi:hypothetical protein
LSEKKEHSTLSGTVKYHTVGTERTFHIVGDS